MKKKINPFKLGLFFMSGAIIVVGGLIWIGAVHLFQHTKMYVTFFDYPVTGLRTGSDVHRLGIKVGRVSAVSLARNGRLVRVVMKLNPGYKVRGNEAVEVTFTGLTSGPALAIVQAPHNLQEITPKIDFPTEYPVIPSTKGIIARIEDVVNQISGKMKRFDTQGLISTWTEAGHNANRILTDKDVGKALDDLKQSAATLKNLLNGVAGPDTAEKINHGIDNFAAASSSIRKAAASISRQIAAVPPGSLADMTANMKKAADDAQRLTGSLNDLMGQTLPLVQQDARRLDQVLSDLEGLVQSLRQEPGRILEQPGGSRPFRR